MSIEKRAGRDGIETRFLAEVVEWAREVRSVLGWAKQVEGVLAGV